MEEDDQDLNVDTDFPFLQEGGRKIEHSLSQDSFSGLPTLARLGGLRPLESRGATAALPEKIVRVYTVKVLPYLEIESESDDSQDEESKDEDQMRMLVTGLGHVVL